MNYGSSDRETLLQKVRWGLDRGAFQSRVGHAAARAVYLGLDDDVTRDLVDGELRELRKLEVSGQLAPFRAARFRRGEIFLGYDCYNQPVSIPVRTLASGTLLLGNTGSGKTSALRLLLPQIVAAGVPVWVTESYKTEL